MLEDIVLTHNRVAFNIISPGRATQTVALFGAFPAGTPCPEEPLTVVFTNPVINAGYRAVYLGMSQEVESVSVAIADGDAGRLRSNPPISVAPNTRYCILFFETNTRSGHPARWDVMAITTPRDPAVVAAEEAARQATEAARKAAEKATLAETLRTITQSGHNGIFRRIQQRQRQDGKWK